MYDPVLNCYYDHKTHTYYELKNWFILLYLIYKYHVNFGLKLNCIGKVGDF